jgi:anti-sigma factor RsiW
MPPGNDAALDCQELVALVTEYLEGTLPAAARRRFESHLDACPGCRNYLAQMQQTLRLLGTLATAAVPPRDRDALLACFRDWKHPTNG